MVDVLFSAYYYGKKKKRKIGRPPGGHTNLEDGPKRPGKRRKRRKVPHIMSRDERIFADSEESGNEAKEEVEDDKSSVSSDRTITTNDVGDVKELVDVDPDYRPVRKRRRRHKHPPPPPSIIKTRGAKLPKFTFERKTHKKIMMTSPPKPPPPKPAKKPPTTNTYVVSKH